MMSVASLGMYTQSRVFWFVFWLLLATLLFAAVAAIILSRSLKFEFQSDDSTFVRGDKVALRLQVNNGSGLPYCRAIPLQLPQSGAKTTGRRAEPVGNCMLPPKGAQSLVIPIDTAHCGVYRAEGLRIRASEPFGLFHVRVKGASDAPTVYIVPRQLPNADFLPPEQTELRPTQSREELADISDFRENDSTRNIHWKHTMRRQKLTATHYEETIRGKTALVIDLRVPQSLSKQYGLQLSDLAGDYAFTAMKQAESENRTLYVWIFHGDGKEESFRVADPGAARNVLLHFATLLPEVAQKGNHLQRFLPDTLVDNPTGVSLCYITHHLTRRAADALHVLEVGGAAVRVAAFHADANLFREGRGNLYAGEVGSYG